MNFKPPRSADTKSNLLVLRRPDPSEGLICQVGSGECNNPCVEIHDDGAGGEFRVCAQHAPELEALGKLIAEMTPNQIESFATIIESKETK